VSDKHLSNVVLLVGFEGTDGSTSFVDESPSGHSLTAVGNAQVDTAQSMFGASSGLFDGNGDYISIPDSDEFTLGAGDFTIETHVRFNVVQTSMFISKYNNSVTPAEWFFGYNGNLIFLAFFGNGGSDFISVTGAVTPVASTWYHAAVTRSGNMFRMFWQGAQVGSLSSAVTLKNTTEGVRIGSRNHSSPSYLNGRLDELRVTRGVARYSAPFVPPRGPFSRYKALGIERATRPATIGTALAA
jgi:Concanavalin A-like lectin/glucanases superfamily